MIKLTRLNGTEYYVNPDLIEIMEKTPDTVLSLVNDKKLIVREDPSEIISRIIEYNRKIFIEKSKVE